MSENVDSSQASLPGTASKLVIMGRSRSGKTTVTNYLSETYGSAVQTVGQHIKDVSHALAFGEGDVETLLSAMIDSDEVRESTSTELLRFVASYDPEPGKPRRLYQHVGDIVRSASPATAFCWEDYVLRCLSNVNAPMVIVDARLEVSHRYFVNRHGFVSLKLEVPEHIRRARERDVDGHAPSEQDILHHASETDVDHLTFDGTIVNDFAVPRDLYDATNEFLLSNNLLPKPIQPDTK